MDKLARLAEKLIRMRAEVVPLRLEKVRRESLRTESVVESQSRAEAGRRHAEPDGRSYDLTPRRLGAVDGVTEEVVEKEVGEVGLLVEGLLDVAQEHAEGGDEGCQHAEWVR